MPPALPPQVNKGPGLIAVTWIEASIGLLLLAARLYTRARIVRNVGWDDWIMIFATVLAIVTSAIVTQMVHYGVGQHAAYIDPPNLINAVQWIWLSTPFSTMSACFGKVSIALLLMRILGTRNKGYTIFLWVLIVLLVLVNIFLSVVTFAQCAPVTWLWDQLNPAATYKGTCWNSNIQKYYGYFQGAFSSFSDLILALLPILIIKDLKIEMRLKAALMVVMSMGIVATAASVVKTVELRNLSTPDFTYNATNLVYWFISENWLIIIAACIPTLAPLYFVILGKRTAESFAVTPSPKGSGRSWNITGFKPSTRKLRSFWTNSSRSESSRGHTRVSSMEKGYISSPNPSSYASKPRSMDEQTQNSETELCERNDGSRPAFITRTSRIEVTRN